MQSKDAQPAPDEVGACGSLAQADAPAGDNMPAADVRYLMIAGPERGACGHCGNVLSPQPAPDEGAVPTVFDVVCLSQVLAEAEDSAEGNRHTAMARAAIAWAERAYGGQVAALRGALEASRLYVLERPANELPDGMERRLDA
ncbi:MAG: hypothetical protein ACYCU7_19005, partial [Acidimicrobiales bacterium]